MLLVSVTQCEHWLIVTAATYDAEGDEEGGCDGGGE